MTHLRSVVFGHRSNGSALHRTIIGMVGDPGQAEYLKDCIERFAAAQSIVLAPESAEDERRMVAMARANQLGDAGGGAQALSSSALGEARLHASRPEAVAGPRVFSAPAAVPATRPTRSSARAAATACRRNRLSWPSAGPVGTWPTTSRLSIPTDRAGSPEYSASFFHQRAPNRDERRNRKRWQ